MKTQEVMPEKADLDINLKEEKDKVPFSIPTNEQESIKEPSQ